MLPAYQPGKTRIGKLIESQQKVEVACRAREGNWTEYGVNDDLFGLTRDGLAVCVRFASRPIVGRRGHRFHAVKGWGRDEEGTKKKNKNKKKKNS